jgi:cobalt-zinc-cadmium resistance protein CzcA
MNLIRQALANRLIMVVIALTLTAFGIRSTMKLSVDAFPDVTNVQVQIATEAPGRSPEEIERFITVPLEIAMTGLPAMTEMRSLNRSGLSIITLVFTDETDVFFARQLVMERLLEVGARLPSGVTPVLGPVSTGLGEVYQYTLEHPKDEKRKLTQDELMERRSIQDWVVRPMLRSIPGVAEINSYGGYEKQYQVLVNPDRLRHYHISLDQIEDVISKNNANSGGGIMARGAEQYVVRGIGLTKSVEDIGKIVLKEEGGIPVFLRDVAEVKIAPGVRFGAMVKDGHTEAVGGVVMMIRGGNAKEIVERIKSKVAEVNSKGVLPAGLKIVSFYDRTELVDASLWMVGKVLIEGVLLVVIVLFLFLGDIRSSLVVIATLIITPLVTFMVMNKIGLSANLMSLGGLAIAIGLMVDGTVVVVENVYHRLGHASKQSRLKVILEATQEVSKPTIYGIAIIILVFLPLMALTGMEGKMFAPLALTIAIALAVSLAVSLLLSPALCAYILRGGDDSDTKIIAWLKSRYLRLFYAAMGAKKKTVLLAGLSLLISIAIIPFLGKSFIPTMKENSIVPQIIRLPNIHIDEALKIDFEVMKTISEIKGVRSAVSLLGRGDSAADPTPSHESNPIISIDPSAGRSQTQIEDDIRQALKNLVGTQIAMNQPIAQRVDEMLTGVRSQLAIKIFGDDLVELKRLSEEVARVVKSVPGSRDIRIDRLSGQQTLSIDINRSAIARYGINASDIHDIIETAIGGNEVSQLYEGERRFSILVRYPENFRGTVEIIQDILVRTSDNALIPLENLADIKLIDSPPTINRESARRRVVVGSNVYGRDLGGFVSDVQREVEAKVKLPEGYYISWGGQFENMQRAMGTLMVIIPVTIAAIFFLLFLMFNSVRLAALIITVLPFASIGGIFSLAITGEYLSVPASVGFIALWGIAVLNGVVLISYIRKLREEGVELAEAVETGCKQRFRPVMMTATVALLGLVPFLFAAGPGSEVQKPLAVVVIGGLITSTLLTLVVLPILYSWFEPPVKANDSEEESLGIT